MFRLCDALPEVLLEISKRLDLKDRLALSAACQYYWLLLRPVIIRKICQRSSAHFRLAYQVTLPNIPGILAEITNIGDVNTPITAITLDRLLPTANHSNASLSTPIPGACAFQSFSPVLFGKRPPLWTALHLAAVLNRPPAVELLLQHGARVDRAASNPELLAQPTFTRPQLPRWSWTPLEVAAYTGALASFESMRKHSSTSDSAIMSAFMVAVWAGALPIVTWLLKSSSNIHAGMQDSWNRTPMWYCVSGLTEKAIDIADILLGYGARLDDDFGNGCNVLHIACAHGHFRIAAYLARKMKNIDSDWNGKTPLTIACHRVFEGSFADPHEDRVRLINLLIHLGADVRKGRSATASAINAAACSRMADIVDILLDAGADPLEEFCGTIPLFSALSKCRPNCTASHCVDPTPTVERLFKASNHSEFATFALAEACRLRHITEKQTLALFQVFVKAGTRLTPLRCIPTLPRLAMSAFDSGKFMVCEELKRLGTALSFHECFIAIEMNLCRGCDQSEAIQYMLQHHKFPADQSLANQLYIRASAFPESPLLDSMLDQHEGKDLSAIEFPSITKWLEKIITAKYPRGMARSEGRRDRLVQRLLDQSDVQTHTEYPELVGIAIKHQEWEVLRTFLKNGSVCCFEDIMMLIDQSFEYMIPELPDILRTWPESHDIFLQKACKRPNPLVVYELLSLGAHPTNNDDSCKNPIYILVNAIEDPDVCSGRPYWSVDYQFYCSLEILVAHGGYSIEERDKASICMMLQRRRWRILFAKVGITRHPVSAVDIISRQGSAKSLERINRILRYSQEAAENKKCR